MEKKRNRHRYLARALVMPHYLSHQASSEPELSYLKERSENPLNELIITEIPNQIKEKIVAVSYK